MLAEELNKFVYLFIRYVIFQCRPQSFIDDQLILYIFHTISSSFVPLYFPARLPPEAKHPYIFYHMLFQWTMQTI